MSNTVIRGDSEPNGILEDVLDAAPEAHQRLAFGAARRRSCVPRSLYTTCAAVGLERAHDHLGQRRLAAAALADEPEALAARNDEAHVVHGAEDRALALAEEAAALRVLERSC